MGYGVKTIPEGDFGSRPTWDEYFMFIAMGVSRRASCHNVRAGVVIVTDKKRVMGTGYNGAPSRMDSNCLDTGCRKKLKGLEYEVSLGSNECIGLHGEDNAEGHLSSLAQNARVLYTTISPCYKCAKSLSGYPSIERVVFKREYSDKETEKAFRYLSKVKIDVGQLDLSLERTIDILIGLPDVKFDIFSKEDFERGRKVLKSLRRKK